MHSATHEYKKIYASDETLIKDIDACAAAIERVTGKVPNVYRFPGGSSLHKDKRELVKNHGYRVVDWNAVCGDEEIPNASKETLVKTALNSAKGKSEVVLLLHDSASHKATANALSEIIRAFKDQGYAFCTY